MGQLYKLPRGEKSQRTIPRTLLREPLTVVVAHENATLHSCIVDIPALRGHRVRVVPDERTAYSLLAAEQVHLVLLDLHLIKDNFVVHLLRQQKQRRHRPPYVIVLSDLLSETDRQHAYRIAADEYWPNLLNLPQLSLRISAALQLLSRRDDGSNTHKQMKNYGGPMVMPGPSQRTGDVLMNARFRQRTTAFAVKIAVVVGPLLTVISQGDPFTLAVSPGLVVKMLLTIAVLYCVASFSFVHASVERVVSPEVWRLTRKRDAR